MTDKLKKDLNKSKKNIERIPDVLLDQNKRPPIIWSVGIFNIIYSCFLLVTIPLAFVGLLGKLDDPTNLEVQLTLPFYFITSIIGLACGIGFLLKKKWAWYGIVILIIATIVDNIVSLFFPPPSNIFIIIFWSLFAGIPLYRVLLTEKIKAIYSVNVISRKLEVNTVITALLVSIIVHVVIDLISLSSLIS